MNEYDFTLIFNINENKSINPETYIDKLYQAGCDDALIGVGRTDMISLNFIRESSSAYDAISSAMCDVKKTIPNAMLIEATPDFVGLTDVSDILGFSRQNMRKIMVSYKNEFPVPIHAGKQSIWHLYQILTYLKLLNKYQIEDKLIEIAEVNMEFNIAKDLAKSNPLLQKNIQSLNI